jgi:uncharacterized DUF497 family protein
MDIVNFNFSPEKNKLLIAQRGISFEEAIEAILDGGLLEITDHPNKSKYPKQKVYIINIDDYVYAVPFIYENRATVFLKTIFPTRKLTKKYLQEKPNA